MGKANAISLKKVAVVNCLIQEWWHKFGKKKLKISRKCENKKNLDFKYEKELSTVEKCGRKSKFTVRTEKKLMQIAKASRTTSHN